MSGGLDAMAAPVTDQQARQLAPVVQVNGLEPSERWCPANGHPPGCYNPIHDVTTCCCGRFAQRGDHGAMGHALAPGASRNDKPAPQLVRVPLRSGVDPALAWEPTPNCAEIWQQGQA